MSSLSVCESVTDYMSKLSPHDASKGEIIDGIARAKKKISEPSLSQSWSLDVTVRSLEDWSPLDQHTSWSIEPKNARTIPIKTSLVVLPFRCIRQRSRQDVSCQAARITLTVVTSVKAGIRWPDDVRPCRRLNLHASLPP